MIVVTELLWHKELNELMNQVAVASFLKTEEFPSSSIYSSSSIMSS